MSRLTRVFLAYATTSPGRVASHSKVPWWYPNTHFLMVTKAVHSQSKWRRSCSSRWQFGQIRSCEGSSQWRYCLREGWCPDGRWARRMSYFLLLICFALWETRWSWYTEATRLWVGGASQIVSLMTWMELDRKIGRMLSVTVVVASLAALSARLLPGTAEWPGIHWMKMEDDMELMELWIENVRGWDEMRALHKELLSVQKSMEVEGCFTLIVW